MQWFATLKLGLEQDFFVRQPDRQVRIPSAPSSILWLSSSSSWSHSSDVFLFPEVKEFLSEEAGSLTQTPLMTSFLGRETGSESDKSSSSASLSFMASSSSSSPENWVSIHDLWGWAGFRLELELMTTWGFLLLLPDFIGDDDWAGGGGREGDERWWRSNWSGLWSDSCSSSNEFLLRSESPAKLLLDPEEIFLSCWLEVILRSKVPLWYSSSAPWLEEDPGEEQEFGFPYSLEDNPEGSTDPKIPEWNLLTLSEWFVALDPLADASASLWANSTRNCTVSNVAPSRFSPTNGNELTAGDESGSDDVPEFGTCFNLILWLWNQFVIVLDDNPSSLDKNSIVDWVGYESMEKASLKASFCSSENKILGFFPELLLLLLLMYPVLFPEEGKGDWPEDRGENPLLLLLKLYRGLSLVEDAPLVSSMFVLLRLLASLLSFFKVCNLSMLLGSLSQSCIRMKGSLPLILNMCHGLGLDSSSLTDPWDRPKTTSPKICKWDRK